MTAPRVFLGYDQKGLWGLWVSRIRVYLLPDALETDETTFVEIERTRVYFDDVLAITYHRAVNVWILVRFGLPAVLFTIVGLVNLAQEPKTALGFIALALPFLTLSLGHWLLKYDYITVYGRRTMARMRFRFQKGKARRIHQDLIAKVRAHQAALAAAQPKPAPPPGPELPPGPPLPDVEPLPPAGPLL